MVNLLSRGYWLWTLKSRFVLTLFLLALPRSNFCFLVVQDLKMVGRPGREARDVILEGESSGCNALSSNMNSTSSIGNWTNCHTQDGLYPFTNFILVAKRQTTISEMANYIWLLWADSLFSLPVCRKRGIQARVHTFRYCTHIWKNSVYKHKEERWNLWHSCWETSTWFHNCGMLATHCT